MISFIGAILAFWLAGSYLQHNRFSLAGALIAIGLANLIDYAKGK